MKFKTGLLVGAAVGYYYGAKAGRERFEQIDAQLDKVRARPAYKKTRDQVGGTVDKARGAVKARAGQVAETAAEKVDEKVDEAVESIRPDDGGSRSTSSSGSSKGKSASSN